MEEVDWRRLPLAGELSREDGALRLPDEVGKGERDREAAGEGTMPRVAVFAGEDIGRVMG